MQLHQLKQKNKTRKSKRVGRGGKRGTYSGRGMKGQRSRSGRRLKPAIRDWIKRYPKLRGYRFKSKAKSQNSKLTVLNLDYLEKKFISGDKVTPQILLEKKIIDKIKGGIPRVKILGKGGIKKDLFIEGCTVSKKAKEEIEKAGGKIS